MNAPLPVTKLKSRREVGEPLVWLSAMGLGVGLLMVVGLLGGIIVNGVEVFWPRRIEVMTIRDQGKELTVAGEIVKVQPRQGAQAAQAGGAPSDELQLFTGNRNKDAASIPFRFIALADVVASTQPAEAVVVERMEYGNAIGALVGLTQLGGGLLPAGDPAFRVRLRELLAEVAARRAAITHLEKTVIGANADEVAELEFHLRALEKRGSAADQADLARTGARVAVLRREYEALAVKARELRQQQSANTLTLRLYGGEEQSMPLGQVVGVTWANELGWFARVGVCLDRLWRFLVDSPREANTEGGIFPAIFGTLVMTMLMSAAVTPFGVVAAIYLREYARQGPVVRMVRIAVNNLAGVPSIVFGVFGLGFFVYIVGGGIDSLLFSEKLPTPTFGTGGIMWAALTLALMTVPVVIVATEESVAAVPRGAREGSLALGASKWQTIQRVILPAAVPGILTGLILAMARGAGEVAPLMLVGVVKLAPSLPLDGSWPFVHLDQKFMHLGFHIYDLGFQSPDSEAAKPMVFATTFFLIVLVMVLNLGAIILRERLRRRFATAAF
jgi:phosphate transport system permease protein